MTAISLDRLFILLMLLIAQISSREYMSTSEHKRLSENFLFGRVSFTNLCLGLNRAVDADPVGPVFTGPHFGTPNILLSKVTP